MNRLDRVAEKLTTTTRKRGIVVFILTMITFLSVISFNPNDNCLSVISSFKTTNFLGSFGAFYSDLLIQLFGFEILTLTFAVRTVILDTTETACIIPHIIWFVYDRAPSKLLHPLPIFVIIANPVIYITKTL